MALALPAVLKTAVGLGASCRPANKRPFLTPSAPFSPLREAEAGRHASVLPVRRCQVRRRPIIRAASTAMIAMVSHSRRFCLVANSLT